MAGGGGRLGIHLGTYAAACECGEPPDLLVGTCGGALVAAVIHAESDPARQLALLCGQEMYRLWCSVSAVPGKGIVPALSSLARRALDRRHAPFIPDLEREALFEAGGPWPALRWQSDSHGTDIVLIGARLTYRSDDVGTARDGRALLQAVAIGAPRALACLHNAPCATGSGLHAGSAVASTIETLSASAIALEDAVRISLTDMIYLAPAMVGGISWLGGAVDLMPVELAARMAHSVWIDRKDPIPRWTMGPAWRSVLGIDAALRQHQVDLADVALRVDHRGLDRASLEPVLKRRIAATRRGLRIEVRAAANATDYRRSIEAQFNEGRRRALSAIAARRQLA